MEVGAFGLAAEVLNRYLCRALSGHRRNSSSGLSTKLGRVDMVMGSYHVVGSPGTWVFATKSGQSFRVAEDLSRARETMCERPWSSLTLFAGAGARRKVVL